MTTTTHEGWLLERRSLIGASETPSILGKGFETAADVWARKIGLADDSTETESMEIGNVIQSALIELATRRIGVPFYGERAHFVRRSKTVQYVGASLDAFHRTEDGMLVPLDTKNVDRIHAKEWEDTPPIGYQIQLQQQMFVTGADHGYLFALIGGNKTAWHRVERNDAFIAAMLKKLEWFWSLVQTRTPPPYQDPYDQARVLAALYPKDAGTAIQLDEAAQRIIERRDALDIAIDEVSTRRAECDNELCAMLGENTFGALPDGRWVSWKQQTRKEHIVKASTFRVLRLHDRRPKDAPALTVDERNVPELECDDMPSFRDFVNEMAEAEMAILGVGGIVRHQSESGSVYYRLPGGLDVRISDHAANEKTSAWMDRHNAVEIRVDEPDWRDRLASITGVLSATKEGTTLCLPQ